MWEEAESVSDALPIAQVRSIGLSNVYDLSLLKGQVPNENAAGKGVMPIDQRVFDQLQGRVAKLPVINPVAKRP